MSAAENEVMVRKDHVPAMSEATNMLAVISRAASDPNIDVEKMKSLLEMHERIVARNALEAYSAAFAQMQPDLPEIAQNGEIKVNSEVRSRYAKFEDINNVCKPILARHGFGISFKTKSKDGSVEVTAILMHRAGHSESTSMELKADTSGSKNGVQALGSSVSYAKRYTMCAILNITTRGQDDDGQRAGAGELVSEEQAANIESLITEVKANRAQFYKLWKVQCVEDILACNYDTVVQLLQAKRR